MKLIDAIRIMACGQSAIIVDFYKGTHYRLDKEDVFAMSAGCWNIPIPMNANVLSYRAEDKKVIRFEVDYPNRGGVNL